MNPPTAIIEKRFSIEVVGGFLFILHKLDHKFVALPYRNLVNIHLISVMLVVDRNKFD
ncbi:hypothetical protein NLX69_09945 [Rossellomorea sp. BNER]|nr:hypothetical protein [Rossellomorea sp. BNER]